MVIDAGDLKTRIKVLKAANIHDAAGNIIPEPYTLRCLVWAKLKAQTSHIQANNNEAIHEILTIITVRYNPSIRQTDRIMAGSRIFEQVGPPINVDEANAWTQLTCKEVVPYE